MWQLDKSNLHLICFSSKKQKHRSSQQHKSSGASKEIISLHSKASLGRVNYKHHLGVTEMEVLIVQTQAPLGLCGSTAGHMFLHSLLEGQPYMLSPVFVEQLPPPELCYIVLTQEKLKLLNEETFQSI